MHYRTDTGTDKAFRATVSDRIAQRTHLLYLRMNVIREWEQFLFEAVNDRLITNLHVIRPTTPIPEPVGLPFGN